MLNLIRMNLFRLVHTKSAIVVFCLLMGFSVLSSCISAYDQAEQKKAIEEQKKAGTWEPDFKGELTPEEEAALQEKAAMEEAQDNTAYDAGYELGSQMSSNIGIYVSTPVDNNGNLMDYLYLYCEELGSGILLLFILIGAVLFFRGDEKNGFLKNIAGQTKHRYNIFFSKLVVTGIYTFVCMACYMLVEFTAFKCSWITVTKSTAAAITIGMCALFGFGIFFSALVQKIFHTGININKYYINTNISNLYLGMDWDAVRFALGIGAGFFILYNVLNVLWFSRKDIV